MSEKTSSPAADAPPPSPPPAVADDAECSDASRRLIDIWWPDRIRDGEKRSRPPRSSPVAGDVVSLRTESGYSSIFLVHPDAPALQTTMDAPPSGILDIARALYAEAGIPVEIEAVDVPKTAALAEFMADAHIKDVLYPDLPATFATPAHVTADTVTKLLRVYSTEQELKAQGVSIKHEVHVELSAPFITVDWPHDKAAPLSKAMTKRRLHMGEIVSPYASDMTRSSADRERIVIERMEESASYTTKKPRRDASSSSSSSSFDSSSSDHPKPVGYGLPPPPPTNIAKATPEIFSNKYGEIQSIIEAERKILEAIAAADPSGAGRARGARAVKHVGIYVFVGTPSVAVVLFNPRASFRALLAQYPHTGWVEMLHLSTEAYAPGVEHILFSAVHRVTLSPPTGAQTGRTPHSSQIPSVDRLVSYIGTVVGYVIAAQAFRTEVEKITGDAKRVASAFRDCFERTSNPADVVSVTEMSSMGLGTDQTDALLRGSGAGRSDGMVGYRARNDGIVVKDANGFVHPYSANRQALYAGAASAADLPPVGPVPSVSFHDSVAHSELLQTPTYLALAAMTTMPVGANDTMITVVLRDGVSTKDHSAATQPPVPNRRPPSHETLADLWSDTSNMVLQSDEKSGYITTTQQDADGYSKMMNFLREVCK